MWIKTNQVKSENPGSVPHPGNSAQTNACISIKLGQTDLQATYPINPMITTQWRQALGHSGHSGPWATVDDLRYPSPAGDP